LKSLLYRLELKLNIEKEKLPLYNLERKQLNGYSLHLKEVSNGRFVEERNFSVHIKSKTGCVSLNPVIVGKYFAGRGKWLKPWIDIVYYPTLKFKETEVVDVSKEGLDLDFSLLLPILLPRVVD